MCCVSACRPKEEYEPRGGTPLYDAVGVGVGLLDAEPEAARRRLLVVVTDGYENASKVHTLASIRELLQRKQNEGWTVLYLGADHDAWAQAEAIGLQRGSVAEFASDNIGSTANVLARATGIIACSLTADFAFSANDRRVLSKQLPAPHYRTGRHDI
jgi:hypothetical protein